MMNLHPIEKQAFFLTSLLLGYVSISSQPVMAQLIPDRSTGTQVQFGGSVEGVSADLIEGGTVRDRNLFHSFQEFNVGSNRAVYFTPANGVFNILTRVTGDNGSNIDGTLGVVGSADLFLINPNGIVFGPNAQLDISGSFVGSTAESIFFEDYAFSAADTDTPPLLTFNMPLGLGMGSNPGALEVNQSTLSVDQALTLAAGVLDISGDLQAGGDITLRGEERRLEAGGFTTDGYFLTQNLAGTNVDFLIPHENVIRADGNVQISDDYEGRSLYVLAGGQVTVGNDGTGNINITDAEDLSDSVTATITDGVGGTQTVTVNATGEPTLDIRTGIEWSQLPGGAPGNENRSDAQVMFGNATGTSGATSANIVAGDITNSGGRVALSTQFFPDEALADTIQVRAVDTRTTLSSATGETITGLDGGDILISSRGDVVTEELNASSNVLIVNASATDMEATGGSGGNVTIAAVSGDITAPSINSSSIVDTPDRFDGMVMGGNAGDITITTSSGDVAASGSAFSFSGPSNTRSPGGDGGDVAISTIDGNIAILDSIDSFTFARNGSSGNSGNILITAENGNISGELDTSNLNASSISEDSSVNGNDDGNNEGQSGSITLSANNQITNLDIFTAASGAEAGSIEITGFGDLTLDDISTATDTAIELDIPSIGLIPFDFDNAGQSRNITVTGAGNLTFDNSRLETAQGIESAGDVLISSPGVVTLQGNTQIFNNTNGRGDAGEVTIGAGRGIVLTGPEVLLSAISTADGNAGSIRLNAPDITLDRGAEISTDATGAGGAGMIQLNGETITIANGSEILAESTGAGGGGQIIVNASTAVNLGEGVEDFTAVISVKTSGAGRGGDIGINTLSFTLLDTAQIIATATETATNDEGGGSIFLNASNINLAGEVAILAETKGEAPAGSLIIQPFDANVDQDDPQLAPNLNITLSPGAAISASTFSPTRGGDLAIFAPEMITIAGPGRLEVETRESGPGGDIEVRTQRLTLTDGVEVSASTFEDTSTPTGVQESGDAGDINIFADTFNLTNGAVLETSTAGSGDAGNIALTIDDTLTLDRGTIIANASDTASGRGGIISIEAGTVQINNSNLTVNSQGQGIGGEIKVVADSLFLAQGSEVDAATASSDGGNITLTLGEILLLSGRSEITATAGIDEGAGNGGDINIQSKFVVALPDGANQIIANAFRGNGGNINIATTSLFGEQFLNIAASSEFGLQGSVTIESPDIDPSQSLVELPTGLVDAGGLIANACPVDGGQGRSQFVAIGRGGLPTQPTSYPTGIFLLPDLGPLATTPPDTSTTALQEAQSWSVATTGDILLAASSANTLDNLLWDARQAYQQADYGTAATLWSKAIETLAQGSDPFAYASTLSNLALAHHHLGEWDQAQSAIATTQQILTPDLAAAHPGLVAQTFNTQASLQFAQGHAEAALNTWQQAANAYAQAGNSGGELRIRLNQTQAWQSLGFYPQAENELEAIATVLADQPPSSVQAMTLLNLGTVLRSRGETEKSQQTLESALTVTQTLSEPALASATLLNLGHTAQAQANTGQALTYYQQAEAVSPTALTQFQAQVSQLDILATQDVAAAQSLWAEISPTFQANPLPASRDAVYAQLNLADTLLQSNAYLASPDHIMGLLLIAGQQAQVLGDAIAQTQILGYQAQVYQQTQQWTQAQALTEMALQQAQELDDSVMVYRWAEQLGQLRRKQGDRPGAIAAYTEAVNALDTLRGDLIASSEDVQFTFRDTVEPVYRDLVKLLLQSESGQSVDPAQLTQARLLIEELQLAELQDYFQDACVQTTPIIADEVDPTAAVIYPIVLDDRLDVIVSVAGQPTHHHSTSISSEQVEQTANQLLGTLTTALGSGQPSTTQQLQQVYDWILAPVEDALKEQQIETLVFVADGALRTLPLTALHTGDQYLVEQYNVVLSPGLNLLDPQPLEREGLQMLAGGISESRPGFIPLPFVSDEIEQITTQIPDHQVLFNQELTRANLAESLATTPADVIHLATHGTFGASAEDTFILTWDGKLNIKDLGTLLQSRDRTGNTPIELLVFSACRTAAGDSRAVLGIAGMAIRSGVRSALAGLWPLDDRATAVFMDYFYKALAEPETTKAEAFRQAQLALMQDPRFSTPYYWSPFVMMGNWL
ncbi:MAG: CHAT domain-containing protein [Cyanobacteria bacterium P01_F01_bin.150]